MQFSLRKYQVEGKEFIHRKKRVMLAFDMGLGKTLAALASLTPEMLPCLVVAPLRVAKFVWPDEIREFKFPYSYAVLHGPKKSAEVKKKVDISIVNFDGLGFLFKHCTETKSVPWKTIMVDESSGFKNCNTKRWKYMRALCDHASNIVLLTGTPGLHHDLFGQLSLLSPDIFGTYGQFCADYFTFDIFGRPELRKNAGAVIEEKAREWVLRKTLDEAEVDMPEISRNVVTFDLPKEAQDKYDAIGDVEEDSFAALRTMASGFQYHVDDQGTRTTIWHHQAKMEVLDEILQELWAEGESVLIVTNYRAERAAIVEKYGLPFIDGTSKTEDESRAFDNWNAGKLKGLVIHPASVGHGLRMEKGGRRVLFYSLPLSQELFDQTIARVFRNGQKRKVFVDILCSANTIDEAIVGLIKKKCLTASNLLAAMTLP